MEKKAIRDNPIEEVNGLVCDVVRSTRKNMVIIPIVLSTLVIVALIIFFSSILPLMDIAKQAGAAVGNTSGTVVGSAVGSVEGASVGIAEGAEAGRTDGLSAKDSVVEISNTIESNIHGLGDLQVLVGNVDLTTYHEVGNTYGALYLTRGSAVFTVALSEVAVTYKEGLISIVIPRPTAEIKIDATETELLADWQRKYFNGNDSQGFEASLNSFKAMKSIAENNVSNYDVLIAMASESAVKQITEIANAVRGNNNDIIVTVSIQAD